MLGLIAMPRSLLLFSAMLFALALSPRAFAATLAELAERARPAVVHLNVFDEGGRANSSGSGFFVSAGGQLVTNHHVIEDAHRVTAKLEDGRELDVLGVLVDDPVRDLAILQVEGSGHSYLPLGSLNQVRPGDAIAVIGSPAGFSGTLSQGIVAAVRDQGLDGGPTEIHSARAWQLQITAPISPGSSGSPILTKDGVVVGVAVGIVTVGQALNFGISADAVQELIAEITPETRPQSFVDRQRGELKRNLLISFVGLGAAAIVAWAISRFMRAPRKRSRASDLIER